MFVLLVLFCFVCGCRFFLKNIYDRSLYYPLCFVVRLCVAPLFAALVFVCAMLRSCVVASDFVVRVACCCVLMLLCGVFVLLHALVCICVPFALLDCAARIVVMARCAVFIFLFW